DRGDYLTNPIHVGTVVYRDSATINGQIGYTSGGVRDENDYFSFTVGKSGNFKVSLDGLWQDAGLALYDSNKNQIKWSDKDGKSSELITANLGTGKYFARVYSYGQQPWEHGATGYSLKIERQADQLESYWKNLLVDSSVENAALNSIKYENGLSRNDVIGILKSAGDSNSVTSTELTDLRNFYNKAINTQNIGTPLKVLSQKVLFSESSNQWYTGSDSIRANLGNLAANSSTNHLNLLIGKHLLGTDRPAIHQDSNNNLAGRYTRANGQLFVGGASANDLVQGATGDCYFLAGLGGVANDKSSAISDMFQDNGDGTWSVRFYTNGKVDYVTVDRMMPTNGDGRYIYANRGQSVSENNELWVALAEKAYAQVNESGRIGQDGNNFYGNGNDNGIGWGFGNTAIQHIANLNTISEGLTTRTSLGGSLGGVDRGELINLVNSDRVLTISGFNANATNNNTGSTNIGTAIQRHVYVVTGYNLSTERFALFNPWGTRHLSLTFNQLMQLGGRVNYSS
ncbi:MAG: C2 family cysteine protease, partial [Cyanobacteria bacterium J06642_11]